jgi:hypothetical protein
LSVVRRSVAASAVGSVPSFASKLCTISNRVPSSSGSTVQVPSILAMVGGSVDIENSIRLRVWS